MVKLQTQNSKLKTRRRGAALLVVLFMIMAVVVISLGILYRADMAAAGAQNYALRTQADYIAWAGLEHARALILANPNDPNTPDNPNHQAPYTLDDNGIYYYYLSPIGEPNQLADPNCWRYDSIECKVYYNKDNTQTNPRSILTTSILYDPNSHTAWFTNIRHSQE